MEQKYLLTVPSWEVHDQHVVFNIQTMPPQGETMHTKRRYSEFERLNRRLAAKGLDKLALPGKLLMHTDAAIEQRRAKLEKALRLYVEMKEMSPLLEEFLSPGDDSALALNSSKQSVGQESTIIGDYSLLSTRAGGEDVPLEVGPAKEVEAATPLLSPDISEDEESRKVVARDEYPLWALELLVARASYRAERQTSLRFARIYTIATIATILGSFSSKVNRYPLLGAAFGTAISAGFAYLTAFILQRSEEKRRCGLGLEESPSSVTDGADVRRFLEHIAERSQKSDKMIETNVAGLEPNKSVGVAAETAAEATKGEASPELLARLDELHDEANHSEIIAVTKLSENPLLVWRWARAVYYQVLEDNNEASASRLEEVLDVLNACVRRTPTSLLHKWIAIVHNSLAGKKGTIKDRVEAGISFERNTRRALELDPNDATLHYMAGRFAFDVTGLTWFERQGARAISGKEPPSASYEEALEHFRRAITIKESPAFRLAEGQTLQKLKRREEALESFKKAAGMTIGVDGRPLTIEEENARAEAEQLVSKLS